MQRILDRLRQSRARPGLHVIGTNPNSLTICGTKARLTPVVIDTMIREMTEQLRDQRTRMITPAFAKGRWESACNRGDGDWSA